MSTDQAAQETAPHGAGNERTQVVPTPPAATNAPMRSYKDAAAGPRPAPTTNIVFMDDEAFGADAAHVRTLCEAPFAFPEAPRAPTEIEKKALSGMLEESIILRKMPELFRRIGGSRTMAAFHEIVRTTIEGELTCRLPPRSVISNVMMTTRTVVNEIKKCMALQRDYAKNLRDFFPQIKAASYQAESHSFHFFCTLVQPRSTGRARCCLFDVRGCRLSTQKKVTAKK